MTVDELYQVKKEVQEGNFEKKYSFTLEDEIAYALISELKEKENTNGQLQSKQGRNSFTKH